LTKLAHVAKILTTPFKCDGTLAKVKKHLYWRKCCFNPQQGSLISISTFYVSMSNRRSARQACSQVLRLGSKIQS